MYPNLNEESSVHSEAKARGLIYVGFGRYADRNHDVKFINKDGRLVPFNAATQSTQSYQKERGNDMGQMAKKLGAELDKALQPAYAPENFSENELNSIMNFADPNFMDQVNQILADYPAGESTRKMDIDMPMQNNINTFDAITNKIQPPMEFDGYIATDSDEGLNVGNVLSFRTYRSLSPNLGLILGPDTKIVLQVYISTDNTGMYMNDYSKDGGFILPRGSQIKVVAGPSPLVGGVAGIDRKIYFYNCEVI